MNIFSMPISMMTRPVMPKTHSMDLFLIFTGRISPISDSMNAFFAKVLSLSTLNTDGRSFSISRRRSVISYSNW